MPIEQPVREAERPSALDRAKQGGFGEVGAGSAPRPVQCSTLFQLGNFSAETRMSQFAPN